MNWIVAVTIIIIVGVAIAYFYSPSTNSRRRNRRPTFRNLVNWYQQTSENAKCASLRKELLRLARSQERAERLISVEKLKNPGKPEYWYLEKVIYDFKRGR